MSLFRYSGLATKVRAMSGKLLKEEDFDQIGSQGSVPAVIAWLKRKPSYAQILGKEDENSLHRGQAEGLIMQSLLADFTKLYRFSNLEQRAFLDGYFRRFEISFLKMLIRSLVSGGDRLTDFSGYEEIFSRHSGLPQRQAAAAQNMDGLISALQETPYGAALRPVFQSGSHRLFDYEFALDMFLFRNQWKRVRKDLKKEDREMILQSVGTQIDVLNLQWIYRAKKYYNMEATEIYAIIIPVHYRLKKEEVREMAGAGSVQELMAAAARTKYGRYLEEGGQPDLERTGAQIEEAIHRTMLGRKPYSAACLEVYLYRKEREVHKVITAMECVRYGLPSEKIREYLS